jgi:hypothetical protein
VNAAPVGFDGLLTSIIRGSPPSATAFSYVSLSEDSFFNIKLISNEIGRQIKREHTRDIMSIFLVSLYPKETFASMHDLWLITNPRRPGQKNISIEDVKQCK